MAEKRVSLVFWTHPEIDSMINRLAGRIADIPIEVPLFFTQEHGSLIGLPEPRKFVAACTSGSFAAKRMYDQLFTNPRALLRNREVDNVFQAALAINREFVEGHGFCVAV